MKSSSGLVLPGGMTGASYLISMVFKICRPKPPRANIPLEWKPCLEHVRQSSGRVGQSLAYVLSLDFYRWQFNLKCRWFFGRVFSFPLVEEFV